MRMAVILASAAALSLVSGSGAAEPAAPAPQIDASKVIADVRQIIAANYVLADVRPKLDAIFGLIDTLQAIDTTGVVPMAHAQDVSLPFRDDAVTAEDCRARFQAQAPEVADGLYIVPRVVE